MSLKSNSFEILESTKNADDNPCGHWTYVKKILTLNGQFVEKQLLPQYSIDYDRCNHWLSEQKYARAISDKVREFKNPNYNVPKTFISNGKVYEELAPGMTIKKLSELKIDPIKKEMSKGKMTIALAHFINDMSELFKTKINDKTDRVEDLTYEEVFELTDFFGCFMGDKNVELIRSVFKFLAGSPENKKLVFVHGDMHRDNIMMDSDGNVSIIDFEMSRYVPQLTAMYSQTLAKKDLWDLVNKLPRTKNSDLEWNFDVNIQFLYFWIDELFKILYKFRKRIYMQSKLVFDGSDEIALNEEEKNFFDIFESDFMPNLRDLYDSVLRGRADNRLKKLVADACVYKIKNK